MTHEYWLGYFGFMMYNLQRNQNPFQDYPEGQDFENWDMGWWESQMEEMENENQILL